MSKRVLVVDDSPMLVQVTVSALAASGYDAGGASDLASLDQMLSQRPVDLLLVDVNMPEMFGDDVVEFIRTQRTFSGKILLYSDLPEDELTGRATASGADGYIVKGRGIEHMLSEVQRFIGPPAEAAGAPQQAESTPPEQSQPSPSHGAQATAAQPSTDAGSPTAAAPEKAEGGRRKRVLVVDDSEMVAALLQADLTAKGFEVFTADNAEKATKIILKKQTRPDLVLLDVRMPNVNGEQFCRFIKGNALFAGIKVLLCSGESVEELRRICREAGADGFVTKDSVLSKVVVTELG